MLAAELPGLWAELCVLEAGFRFLPECIAGNWGGQKALAAGSGGPWEAHTVP